MEVCEVCEVSSLLLKKNRLKTTSITTDGIANVTEANHVVKSGFVGRKVVPDGKGGYKIVTYGEGNSRLQTLPTAESRAKKFWTKNANKIISRAR